MELNMPYGESAEDLERTEDKETRLEVAIRLVSQATDTCAMCACALDSAFMDGRPMPEGIYPLVHHGAVGRERQEGKRVRRTSRRGGRAVERREQ